MPEVLASAYDLRSTKITNKNRLMDGKKLADVKVPFLVKLFENAVKKIKGTMIEELLKDANLI